MQRQLTIELRADFKDQDKYEELKKLALHAARHLLASAKLLGDGQEPEAVVFSDDFFTGSKEIPLLEDALGDVLSNGDAAEEPVSQELLDALKR